MTEGIDKRFRVNLSIQYKDTYLSYLYVYSLVDTWGTKCYEYAEIIPYRLDELQRQPERFAYFMNKAEEALKVAAEEMMDGGR